MDGLSRSTMYCLRAGSRQLAAAKVVTIATVSPRAMRLACAGTGAGAGDALAVRARATRRREGRASMLAGGWVGLVR